MAPKASAAPVSGPRSRPPSAPRKSRRKAGKPAPPAAAAEPSRSTLLGSFADLAAGSSAADVDEARGVAVSPAGAALMWWAQVLGWAEDTFDELNSSNPDHPIVAALDPDTRHKMAVKFDHFWHDWVGLAPRQGVRFRPAPAIPPAGKGGAE